MVWQPIAVGREKRRSQSVPKTLKCTIRSLRRFRHARFVHCGDFGTWKGEGVAGFRGALPAWPRSLPGPHSAPRVPAPRDDAARPAPFTLRVAPSARPALHDALSAHPRRGLRTPFPTPPPTPLYAARRCVPRPPRTLPPQRCPRGPSPAPPRCASCRHNASHYRPLRSRAASRAPSPDAPYAARPVATAPHPPAPSRAVPRPPPPAVLRPPPPATAPAPPAATPHPPASCL